MKTVLALAAVLIVILSIFVSGCSSSDALKNPVISTGGNEPIISGTQGGLGEKSSAGNRETIGAYLVDIIPDIPEVKIEQSDRVGSYHFNLTKINPKVLSVTSYGKDPNHGGNFYVDIRLSHPYPGSGIDGFDPRIIAILPADSQSNTMYFPLLQVTANNKVVMEPDGYTKLFDNYGMAGNTNPFKAYFKDQPYRVWSSTGVTQETRRWYINLAGFKHGIRFYLVCDVCTGFPNPPTPVNDNAKEPVDIRASIGTGLYANGGYADVDVTITDWQRPEWVDVKLECPRLFDSIIDLDLMGPVPEPNKYQYKCEIGNYKSAPKGDYSCLISAFDGFYATGNYSVAIAHVSDAKEPVITDSYYDFSTIDIKGIHLSGEGFGNEQDSSVVYVDGETSGFTIADWSYEDVLIHIPNDNLDHTVQLEIDGFMTDVISLPESSTIFLVYNSNNADSIAIKDYYASPVTGRNLDSEMTLGLALSLGEQINRTQYNEQIKSPIENYILTHDLKYRIKYVVLAKGMPLKIAATGGSDYTNLDYAALDTELSLLFTGAYSLPGRILSPYYGRTLGEYFHPFKYRRGSIVMAYLVTRLAAWTLDEVYDMIDRGLNGYSGSAAYGILDGDPGKPYDRMEAAEIIYVNRGIQHLYDNSTVFLTADTIGDPSISQNVLGYTGHGVHHNESPPGGGLYVFELGFGLLNGAIFNTYESFNCTSFDEANRSGHGMVGDWIRIGGTGGIGHVYEPWSDAVGDERYLYPAQLAGNNLAEACYLAGKYLSWTETMVGDPLCMVHVE